MRRANDNEAITKLPILLFAGQEAEGDGWVSDYEAQSGGGMLAKRQAVRVVPATAVHQFASPKTRAAFESAFGQVPEDSARELLSLLGIAGATEKKNLKLVASLAWRAETSRGTAAPYVSAASAVREPWDCVGAMLNTGGTRLVLWQKESYKGSRLVPALLCATAAQALFAHALFLVSGKRGLGVCRRCRNPFPASRGQQSFCSYHCRVAEAMKRYRAKLKLKESQKRKRARQAKSSARENGKKSGRPKNGGNQ